MSLLAIVLPLALGVAPPAAAQPAQRWQARLSGTWLSPTGDQVSTDEAARQTTLEVADDATGYGLALEYQRWRRLGIEGGVLRLDMDTTMRVTEGESMLSDVSTVSLTSIHIAVNWHLAPAHRTDLSVGGLVAQTSFKDVFFFTDPDLRQKRTFDDDIGIGVKATAEFPLGGGDRWGVFADLRYLDMILESEVAGQDLDFRSTILSLGVSCRF